MQSLQNFQSQYSQIESLFSLIITKMKTTCWVYFCCSCDYYFNADHLDYITNLGWGVIPKRGYVSATNSLKVLFGMCFYLVGVELYINASLFSLQALVAILPWTSPMFSPFLWFIASLCLFSIVTYTLVCTHAHPFYMHIYRHTHIACRIQFYCLCTYGFKTDYSALNY